MTYRADKELKVAIGSLDGYRGVVENRQYLGSGPLELKAIWDAAHPDDQMEMPLGFEGRGESEVG